MPAPVAGRVGSGRTERPRVADVLRAFVATARERHAFTVREDTIIDRITRCQTAAMGGHLIPCAGCGTPTPAYNSCRDRHCLQCQWTAQNKWIEARQERILPVPYFHTVFTIPAELRAIVSANPARCYALLFDAVARTIRTCARDPKRLGAMPAFTLLLHTWDRALNFHPHIHGVISAGGLTDNGTWKATARPGRKSFLFPVRVMGKLFKSAFLTGVIELLWRGELVLPDPIAHDVLDRLRAASRAKWVVYAKRPFAGAEHVYRYLGRYTHRVGVSNSRIIAIDGDHVRFHTKGGKAVRIPGVEFVRRFARHVLPKGFTRIRHYGLIAPANVNSRWIEAHAQLVPSDTSAAAGASPAEGDDVDSIDDSAADTPPPPRPHLCPVCRPMHPRRVRDPPQGANSS
ncbi:MAG TPA: transposase [Casimicrobiaceae bacterium]|nr:transposase [Casimicrobiaceae bacterium]